MLFSSVVINVESLVVVVIFWRLWRNKKRRRQERFKKATGERQPFVRLLWSAGMVRAFFCSKPASHLICIGSGHTHMRVNATTATTDHHHHHHHQLMAPFEQASSIFIEQAANNSIESGATVSIKLGRTFLSRSIWSSPWNRMRNFIVSLVCRR